MPFRCASGDYTHNEEPTLDALGEPIVRLVMVRDRVAEVHIRQLIDAVLRRRSLSAQPSAIARAAGSIQAGGRSNHHAAQRSSDRISENRVHDRSGSDTKNDFSPCHQLPSSTSVACRKRMLSALGCNFRRGWRRGGAGSDRGGAARCVTPLSRDRKSLAGLSKTDDPSLS